MKMGWSSTPRWSRVIIDTNKDMGGYNMTNVGDINVGLNTIFMTDGLRGGSLRGSPTLNDTIEIRNEADDDRGYMDLIGWQTHGPSNLNNSYMYNNLYAGSVVFGSLDGYFLLLNGV